MELCEEGDAEYEEEELRDSDSVTEKIEEEELLLRVKDK